MMQAESYRFQVGEMTCYALRDGSLNYPLALFFPGVDREGLAEAGLPGDGVATPLTLLLVDTGERRVLVDTGAGRLAEHAGDVFPGIDQDGSVTGLLVESLRHAGYEPGDIDTVVITHAHPDHIAGMLDSGGGLTFANAEYVMSRDEYAFWTSPLALARAMPGMAEMALENLQALEGRLTLAEYTYEAAPGVTLLDAAGHTPGHVAVAVNSGDEELLHIADTALHPLHLAEPGWTCALDMDVERASASRKQVMNRATGKGALVFAHHFGPFPALGRVRREGKGWRWVGGEGGR
jgi:glyoxylase-like metal-dependent hydrolase (beta-lactamase superfamily II)